MQKASSASVDTLSFSLNLGSRCSKFFSSRRALNTAVLSRLLAMAGGGGVEDGACGRASGEAKAGMTENGNVEPTITGSRGDKASELRAAKRRCAR